MQDYIVFGLKYHKPSEINHFLDTYTELGAATHIEWSKIQEGIDKNEVVIVRPERLSQFITENFALKNLFSAILIFKLAPDAQKPAIRTAIEKIYICENQNDKTNDKILDEESPLIQNERKISPIFYELKNINKSYFEKTAEIESDIKKDQTKFHFRMATACLTSFLSILLSFAIFGPGGILGLPMELFLLAANGTWCVFLFSLSVGTRPNMGSIVPKYTAGMISFVVSTLFYLSEASALLDLGLIAQGAFFIATGAYTHYLKNNYPTVDYQSGKTFDEINVVSELSRGGSYENELSVIVSNNPSPTPTPSATSSSSTQTSQAFFPMPTTPQTGVTSAPPTTESTPGIVLSTTPPPSFPT